MTLFVADRAPTTYGSIGTWSISILDALAGSTAGPEVVRFERGRSTIVDYLGAEPINVFVTLELTR